MTLIDSVVGLLDAIDRGEVHASEQLLALVYDDLRELAARKLSRELPGQTLQPTALVHEAYLRLVKDHQTRRWDSRGHFFAAAAEAMRRILIDLARRKISQRHGGSHARLDLDKVQVADKATPEAILALNEVLEHLAKDEPIVAEVVKMRFFVGLSIEETAKALNIASRTVNRHWSYARAWLYKQLSEQNETEA